MTPEQVIARARSQIGHKTKYELSRGGFYPTSLTAADTVGRCDCSGFVAWCLESSRHIDHPAYKSELGEWVSTAAIVRDAMRSASGMFALIPLVEAIPSDVYVWAGSPFGHSGIISEVGPAGPTKVIHCSSGNYRGPLADAIQETSAHLFIANNAIVARCHHVERVAAVA